MPEMTLTIHHKSGLHARPAAMFVQTANKYQSVIKVKHGEREVNAKSIMGILTLGASQGRLSPCELKEMMQIWLYRVCANWWKTILGSSHESAQRDTSFERDRDRACIPIQKNYDSD
ncbi:MAG: HPr family phosphocarrier protein [Anaerolineales bacterium]|nr:HPr family phosphocarrier protein [Anaerolineales bacterium]